MHGHGRPKVVVHGSPIASVAWLIGDRDRALPSVDRAKGHASTGHVFIASHVGHVPKNTRFKK